MVASDNSHGVHFGLNGTTLKSFGTADLIQFHYNTARTVKIPPIDTEAVASLKTTVQGLNAEPFTIIQGPQHWKAADLRGEENHHKWQYNLTPSDIAEIETALQLLEARGSSIDLLKTKEDPPLPSLGPRLIFIRDTLVHGQGIFLIRGFPVEKFSKWQTASFFYALGLHLGFPVAQNNKGHVLGHIKAIGTDPKLPGVRPYTTSTQHGYHCDNSDIRGAPLPP